MSAGWRFSRTATDEGQAGGDPSEYAFDHDLKDFVRETLQNANDAGPESDGPVEVTYRLREYTGSELEQLKQTLHWDETDLPSGSAHGESLQLHLQAAADSGRDRALRQLLDSELDEKILVVTVEDRNTCGLYGEEDGDGPYTALVLDELITQKDDASSSGGSYGLGKAVLWAWSGISTVAFHSHSNDAHGNDPPRFIARTQLPSHEPASGDYRYKGRGLFGNLNGGGDAVAVGSTGSDVIYKWGDPTGRPYSLWGSEAGDCAKGASLEPISETGTNVTVIGFSEPGSGTQPDPGELADDIAEQASKWFWPAMLQESLEVTVDAPTETIGVNPDTCEDVRPFVQCVKRRNSAGNVLESPGEVAVKSPEFEIEDETESAAGSDDVTTESGPIDVYARLADPDREATLANHVALVRGAGMVVKYYDRNRVVYGGRDFHGVVLAGEARPWTDGKTTQADTDIDDYLTAAEPPKHDDWTDTKRLKEWYEQGATSTIKGLQRNLVTDAIRDLVRETRREGKLVAGRLAERLDIPEGRGDATNGGGPEGGSGASAVQGTAEIAFDPDDRQWEFSGLAKAKEDAYDIWEIEIHLRQTDEDGNTIGEVPIEEIDSDDIGDLYVENAGDGKLVRADSSIDHFAFEGWSAAGSGRLETEINIDGTVYVGGDES